MQYRWFINISYANHLSQSDTVECPTYDHAMFVAQRMVEWINDVTQITVTRLPA